MYNILVIINKFFDDNISDDVGDEGFYEVVDM